RGRLHVRRWLQPVPFEHHDVVAGACEQQRGEEARGAASGDGYSQRPIRPSTASAQVKPCGLGDGCGSGLAYSPGAPACHSLRARPAARVAVSARREGRGGVMTKPFRGVINVDVTQSVPDWEPYTQPIAPEGTPNVLYIVLDDVGYSAMEPYGGLIETPNINRITQRGLTYTNFHTTALCSPTRSCLMTGRNHTTNGMATITEAASGFPSSNGHIPFECATIAEVLGERGWNTYMVGKWHLTAEDEMNMASRK